MWRGLNFNILKSRKILVLPFVLASIHVSGIGLLNTLPWHIIVTVILVESNTTTTENDDLDAPASNDDDVEHNFSPLLGTPNVEELTKTLKGKSTKPLVSVVAARPMSMTESILKHANKMLDKQNKTVEKVETQTKLNSKSNH